MKISFYILNFLALIYNSKSCSLDADCYNLNLPNEPTDLTTLANYYCISGTCKYLVKAGEFCNTQSDCLAYEYLKRSNQTLTNLNLCSSEFCTLESNCGGAWSLNNSPNKNIQSTTCCSGVPLEGKCPAKGLNNVDVCGYSLTCNEHYGGASTCEKGKTQQNIWIGCLLVLLAGAVLNLGLNIQKFALNYHNKQPKLEECPNPEHNPPTQANTPMPLSRSNSRYNQPQTSGNASPRSDAETSEDFPESSRRLNIITDQSEAPPLNRHRSLPASPTTPKSPRPFHQRTLSRASMAHSVKSFSEAIQSVKQQATKWEKFVQRVMAIWSHSVISPLWVFGLFIYILGALLNFAALQFAPQSLVGPLGSVSLITNIILAPLINKEKISKTDFIGIILIIGGCVLVVVFAGVVPQNYRICVLLALFRRLQTIIYLIVICFLVICSFYYIHTIEHNMGEPTIPPNPHSSQQYQQAQAPGLNTVTEVNTSENFGEASEKEISQSDGQSPPVKKAWYKRLFHAIYSNYIWFMKTITPTFKEPLTHKSKHYKYALPIAYAVIAALMATLTTMFAKTLANLITESIFHSNNQFGNWLSWIILIVVVTTALLQLFWITMGLQRYDALLQVPVFYVIWTMFDIIGGGIYFNEFVNFTVLQYCMFALGVFIIFSGVAVLAHRMKDVAI